MRWSFQGRGRGGAGAVVAVEVVVVVVVVVGGAAAANDDDDGGVGGGGGKSGGDHDGWGLWRRKSAKLRSQKCNKNAALMLTRDIYFLKIELQFKY
jgi:hypothetical protein